MNNEFLTRMQNLLKDDYEAFIASLKQEEVKGFYLNPLKQDVLKHLDTKYIQKHPYIKDVWGSWWEDMLCGKPFIK